MKKFLIIICFILFVFPVLAEEMYPGEIDLESYLNDFNTQTLKTKNMNEKFKKKNFEDFEPRSKGLYGKKGDFSFSAKANSSKDSKLLLDGVDQKTSLNYDKNKFGLSVGSHSSYTKDYASNTTREVFFTPKYKCTDHLSLELNNYLDTKGDYFTQELGLKYKSRIFKNGSYGISGGTKFNKDSTKSEKLKFSTEFYLF